MPKQPPNQPDPTDQAVPDDVLTLILRYHDNDLDDAGLSKLREALTQSQPARALFVRWALHSQLLSESLSANYHEEAEDPWQGSTNFLAELAKLEQQAQAPLVHLHHIDKPRYTGRWALAFGAWAAVLVIALTLIIALPSGNTPALKPFTDNIPTTPLNKPAESAKPTPRDHPTTTPVATITAQHNATWGRPASAGTDPGTDAGPEHPPTTGTKLHPNDRLNLTAGFAEITTSRGAVVILEAPATIELIDHNNALRLHTGKLVGICETDASKGFLVRTPHMDITDLGTRFGVTTDQQASSVRVIEGEVEVASTLVGTNAELTPVFAGQGFTVDATTGQLQQTDDADTRFAYHWHAIIRAPQLTGPIHYEPSIPNDLRAGASEDTNVRLFHERSAVLLDQPVYVDIIEPGRYQAADLVQTHLIQGKKVDSYLIHFDSEDNTGTITRRTFTVRFDRPVLGVIANSKQLAASHRQLGVPGAAYGNQTDWTAFDGHDSSGIDVTRIELNQDQNDAVRLSDDRQTLTLTLAVVDAIDQVRVLVQSEAEQLQ